jgi:hypothetical protein
MDGKQIEGDDVVQGRIFWLPPKAELPEKAVRRAHGKGVIEEGIYNHPVVVVSRPDDDRSIVHFHLVRTCLERTSNVCLQRLDYVLPGEKAQRDL